MAHLAGLHRVGMLFVGELSSLVLISLVMLRIIDGDHIRLTKDTLQGDQRSKEHKGCNNGNELSIHRTPTSFLRIPFLKTQANRTNIPPMALVNKQTSLPPFGDKKGL